MWRQEWFKSKEWWANDPVSTWLNYFWKTDSWSFYQKFFASCRIWIFVALLEEPPLDHILSHLNLVNTLCLFLSSFLGAFAAFRKATVSFILSVRPLAHTGRIFIKFYIRWFFDELSRKFKLHYNLRQNIRYFTGRPRGEFRPRQTRQLPRAVDWRGGF